MAEYSFGTGKLYYGGKVTAVTDVRIDIGEIRRGKSWTDRPLTWADFRGVHFDRRVTAHLGEGFGDLVVCDTFDEFAPVLTEALAMRRCAEALVEKYDAGLGTDEKLVDDLRASIARSRVGEKRGDDDDVG